MTQESVKLWKKHRASGIQHSSFFITQTFPLNSIQKCLKSTKWTVRESLMNIGVIYEHLK